MDQQSTATFSPFEQCPFEIATHIASMELGRSDMLNLRLTSRRMCILFTPLAFHQYTHRMRLSGDGIRNSEKKRVSNQPAYSPIPAAFAPHITHLRVKVLSFPDFGAMESANSADADGNRKFGRLWEEISQLTSIKWLEWLDQSWVVKDDVENVRSLPILLDKTISAVQAASGMHLQKIRICGRANLGSPNSLVHLDGLSELMVEWPWNSRPRNEVRQLALAWPGPEERRRALASQIRSIITRNRSTLQHIYLRLSLDTTLTLEDIFPPEAVELRLTRVNLPRMQNSVPKALASVPQLCELLTSYEYARPSEVDHIWDALRVHGIVVQKTSNYPTISHMKYLSSFSGLSTFSLTISSPVDPAIVNLFFNAVLPAQAASLETITFRYDSRTPIYDGFVYSSRYQWFGHLSFPRLRSLEVYAPSDWDINQLRCQSLLHDLQDFPALDVFSVQWPKYTEVPQAFDCDQLPLHTKTGRPSRLIIRINHDYGPTCFEIEVGKSHS